MWAVVFFSYCLFPGRSWTMNANLIGHVWFHHFDVWNWAVPWGSPYFSIFKILWWPGLAKGTLSSEKTFQLKKMKFWENDEFFRKWVWNYPFFKINLRNHCESQKSTISFFWKVVSQSTRIMKKIKIDVLTR